MQKRYLLIALAIVALIGAIWSYVLLTTPPQQTLDQEVRDVGLQLKCLTCQGENVADSPSVFAGGARNVIRQQLQSGKSEQQVVQYFVFALREQYIAVAAVAGFPTVSVVGSHWYAASRPHPGLRNAADMACTIF